MKTAIMTDSNSGITQEEGKSLGVFVIPMPVIIDGNIFFEGTTITEKEFYEKQEAGAEITTSMPAAGDVLAMWDELLEAGYDQIAYIPMTSGLSHSCEMAAGLAEDKNYKDKVYVVDNHRISVPMRYSVMTALGMARQGCPAAEIKERLEREGGNSIIYISVNTLEYLRKGGRITAATAALGTLFGVRPVLSIDGGKLDMFAKGRSMKRCALIMLDALKKDIETRFAGQDFTQMKLCVAGTMLSAVRVDYLVGLLKEAFPGVSVHFDPLSVSIGCHTGPGAEGMAVCFE